MLTVAATALRASEVIALRWADILWDENQIRVSKRWRKGKDGETKTSASDSTVALGSILAHYLRVWKEASPYTAATDFVFPSRRKNGSVPVCASVFVRHYLRPLHTRQASRFPIATASDFTTCVTASAIG